MYYFALFVFSTSITSLFKFFYNYLVIDVLQGLLYGPNLVLYLVILYFSLKGYFEAPHRTRLTRIDTSSPASSYRYARTTLHDITLALPRAAVTLMLTSLHTSMPERIALL